jgi:hypothetical protein
MILMPNFIRLEMPSLKRQEGFKEWPNIPVGDLTADEAAEYAEWIRVSFLEHWKNKKQSAAPKP